MPTYVFRCGQGCPDFTEQHSMASVPADTPCPSCSGAARRRIGAPALGAGNSPGMRVQDATRATADRPDVVQSLPTSRRRAPVTTNPLHRKLPRP
ncbi:FmdB family zinc ribbon protein [Mycobacterium sp. SMC-17]|uniref:FmdB family zinc ribbon protein n=1 Tax=Mycobacterium sp. SMC-17 TaxID=3381628 RepID=UPI003875E8AE